MTDLNVIASLLAHIAGDNVGDFFIGHRDSDGTKRTGRYPVDKRDALAASLVKVGRTGAVWIDTATWLGEQLEPVHAFWARATNATAADALRNYPLPPSLLLDTSTSLTGAWWLTGRGLDSFAASIACRRIARATGCTVENTDPGEGRLPLPGCLLGHGARVTVERHSRTTYAPMAFQHANAMREAA